MFSEREWYKKLHLKRTLQLMYCGLNEFLGVLELIVHYDPVLLNHLQTVKDSQQSHHRLHCLSSHNQNEFIELCAQHVREEISNEREN